MEAETFPLGILINAFVTSVVSITAFAFVIFLTRRWRQLSPAMRGYAWFWFATSLLWACVTIRYLMVISGYNEPSVRFFNEFIVEVAVFSSGIALYFYLGMQLFKTPRRAFVLTGIGVLSAIAGLWQFLLPGGFHPGVVTAFTADPVPSFRFLLIFGSTAGLALILLVRHVYTALRIWRTMPTGTFPYALLYSLSLIIYVTLGIIDQIKIIIDWPLVVFRILYTAVFLFAYLILTTEEEQRQNYLQQKTVS